MSIRFSALLAGSAILLASCSSALRGTEGGGLRNELTKQPSPYSITEHSTLASAAPGSNSTFAFTITRSGKNVRDFDITHEKLLHLIVVRNDLSQFQHLHPEFDVDTGRFSVPITVTEPGTYALFTDFKEHDTDAAVLRKDIVVGAPTTPTRLAIDDGRQEASGYTVTPSVASPIPAGVETMLVFTVEKDGQPVTDLQNYLGAKGHAVVLSEQTLEYFHTHPAEHGAGHGDGELPGPGEVHFQANLPTPGRYKVFAQFRPEGELITVSNVYEVAAPPADADTSGGGHGEGHGSAPAREVRIESFQYGYAPNEIRVKAGEPVELVLSTRDVAHSFMVEGLDVGGSILPGEETRLAFTAERTGRFRFGCDVYCGEGHPDMSEQGGTLIVE